LSGRLLTHSDSMSKNKLTTLLRDWLVQYHTESSAISYDNGQVDSLTGWRIPDIVDDTRRLQREIQDILRPAEPAQDSSLVPVSDLHLSDGPSMGPAFYSGSAAWIVSDGRRKLRHKRRLALCKYLGVCPYERLRMVNRYTGELRPFNCKSWDCAVCAKKLQAKYAIKFAAGEPDYFCTITGVSEDVMKARLDWQHMIRCLRGGYGVKSDAGMARVLAAVNMINARRAGNRDKHPPLPMDVVLAALDKLREGYKFEYVRVIERGGRGQHKLHYHLMVRGELPPEVVMGAVAYCHGFGYITDITKVYDQGASWYISKYLTKANSDIRQRQRVSGSRGFEFEKPPKPPVGLWAVQGTAHVLRADVVSAQVDVGLLESGYRRIHSRNKGIVRTEIGPYVKPPRRLPPGLKIVGDNNARLRVFLPWPAEWIEFWASQPLRMQAKFDEWRDRCEQYTVSAREFSSRQRIRQESAYRARGPGFIRRVQSLRLHAVPCGL